MWVEIEYFVISYDIFFIFMYLYYVYNIIFVNNYFKRRNCWNLNIKYDLILINKEESIKCW